MESQSLMAKSFKLQIYLNSCILSSTIMVMTNWKILENRRFAGKGILVLGFRHCNITGIVPIMVNGFQH